MALNEKKLNSVFEFSYIKKLANFELFRWTISSSINFIFLEIFHDTNLLPQKINEFCNTNFLHVMLYFVSKPKFSHVVRVMNGYDSTLKYKKIIWCTCQARCELLSIKKKEKAFLDPRLRTTKKCVKLQKKNIGQPHITQSR